MLITQVKNKINQILNKIINQKPKNQTNNWNKKFNNL